MARTSKKAGVASRTVLLTWFPPRRELAKVKAGLPSGTLVLTPKPRRVVSPYEVAFADVVDLVPSADVIVGQVVPEGLWQKAERLRAVVWLHAGVQELPFAWLKQRGVRVANTRGANASAVAEQTMTLVLALAKKLVVKHENVVKARWTPFWKPENLGTLLEGKTMTVVGFGGIGERVARIAKAFDMRVVAVRRHPEKGAAGADAVFGTGELHRALAEADVAVIATPLTRETEGFIDRAALAAMKPTALLVNVARGNLVQEYPLYQALTQGRLGGFAADVWWHYANAIPATYHFATPSRTNLQHLPNVVCSGDHAARVPEVRARVLAMAIESAAAFLEGRPMPREIDLDLGY